MNHHQSSKHIADMYIHVATHFNGYCYRYHIPRVCPNTRYTMVIGDVTFLLYDISNSKAAVQATIARGLNETLWTGKGGKYECIMGQMGQNSQK